MNDPIDTKTLRTHFLGKEGQRIEVPTRLQPLKDYLEHHRNGGDF